MMRTRRVRWRIAIAAALALVALVPLVGRAIVVSPLAIFMDQRSRSAEIRLANSSAHAEEVTIDLKYGYATTDSLDRLMAATFEPDSVAADAPSAARWIRVFPRKVVLAPGQVQTVRLFASPPAGLPDGEYWARFLASSHELPDSSSATSGVRAGISFVIITSIPLWYRKGVVTTSANIDTLEAAAAADSLRVRFVVARGGNASFIGTAKFSLLDAREKSVREWQVPLAIFARYRRRVLFPLDKVPAGTYTLAMTLSAVRADLQTSDLTPAADARARVTVLVP
jgi:P pilus assembly chaperone PapD